MVELTQTADGYYVQCPNCNFGKNFPASERESLEEAHSDACAYQRRYPCPDCERGLACAPGLLERGAFSSEGDPVEART